MERYKRIALFYGFSAKVPTPYPLKEFDLANKIAVLGMDKDVGIPYFKKLIRDGFFKD